MTNDELLAKLLDNSLTETDQRELSGRMAASPQFAEEVREFLAVEEVLQKNRSSVQPAVPLTLIDSVENTVAATIAAGSGTVIAAGAAGRVSMYPRILGSLSAVVVVGGAVWYLLSSGSEPARISQPIAQEQSSNIVAPAPHAPAPANAQQQQAQPASAPLQQQELQTTQTTNNDQQADHGNTQTPAASIRDKQSMDAVASQDEKVRRELATSLAVYEKSKAAGDAVNTMLKAKQIGIFYCTLADFESSRMYLDEALVLAQQLKLEESEASIIGQMGLLEKARGAESQAVKLIEDCVSRLKALDSPELQRWQDELRKLQTK